MPVSICFSADFTRVLCKYVVCKRTEYDSNTMCDRHVPTPRRTAVPTRVPVVSTYDVFGPPVWKRCNTNVARATNALALRVETAVVALTKCTTQWRFQRFGAHRFNRSCVLHPPLRTTKDPRTFGLNPSVRIVYIIRKK